MKQLKVIKLDGLVIKLSRFEHFNRVTYLLSSQGSNDRVVEFFFYACWQMNSLQVPVLSIGSGQALQSSRRETFFCLEFGVFKGIKI